MAAAKLRFIEAAGGLLWRPSKQGPQIAVVHRPQYDDWSLPKGKVDHGEHGLLAAVREVEEETGFVGRPGRILGEIRYVKDGVPKRVHYWAMEVVGGGFAAGDEVDELAWLSVPETLERLNPARDRTIAQAFTADVRPTTALVVVRHGSAGEREPDATDADDDARPLDERGRSQAVGLVPLLAAFGVRRVVSANVVRCLDTVAPFARSGGICIETDDLLSETGYLADPQAAFDAVQARFGAGQPIALCSQGKAIVPLLQRICAESSATEWHGDVAKGGFVVLHFATTDRAALVAVDSYPSTA